VTGKADQILDLSSNRPEPMEDESAVAEDKPASVALVPILAPTHRSRIADQRLSRADFVAQLIATAEHVPQTRGLRRGTSADAKAAYGASWHKPTVQRAGNRTRQII
jgi:hypothetical protein